MRRSTLLLTTLCLASCAPDEANQKQADATKKFDTAYQHLEYVKNDNLADPVADGRGVKGVDFENLATKPTVKPYGKTIVDYRQEQLKKAAAELEPVSKGGGPAAQQMASQLLLAEAHSSAARNASAGIAVSWGQQANSAAKLIAVASSLRLADHFTVQQGAVDFTSQLAELRKVEEAVVQKQDALVASLGKAADSVKGLEAEAKVAGDGKQAKTAEAEELARKAFPSKGQAQYDLYVQSAAATRAADLFTAQGDVIAAQLDVQNAEMKVLQARAEGAKSELEQIREAIKTLERRSQENVKVVKDSKAGADALVKAFDEQFNAVALAQQKQITEPFAAAEKECEQAITLTAAATQSAPQETRTHADISAATALAELGFLYRQQSAIAKGYSDLLTAVGESVSKALPADRVAAIQTAAGDAGKSAAALREQSSETLAKAAVKFTEIADAAKGKGDKALERNALENLIQANASIASLTSTSDEATNDKLNALRDRVKALPE